MKLFFHEFSKGQSIKKHLKSFGSRIKIRGPLIHSGVSPDSGRSMTEMLGVLAIIGVLSITALVGYQYAMNKYRANETINELKLRALSTTQERQAGKLSDFMAEHKPTTRLGYPAIAYLLEDPSYFEIQLDQVPPTVCEQILKSNWRMPLDIIVNDVSYRGDTGICGDEEELPATMAFQFKMDLDEEATALGKCKSDADCSGGCTKCEDEQCVSTCVGDERCATDKETGADVCCPKDQRSGPYCCPSTVNGWCCDENKQNCCPWHKPLRDKNGTCYACDHPSGVDVTGVQGNCNVCGERELLANSCVLPCPSDAPLRGNDGKCYSCDNLDPIRMHPPEDYCEMVCPNRVSNGGVNYYCSLPCGEGIYADKPLTDHSGRCHACDEEKSIDVTNVKHDGCEKCDQRILARDSGSYLRCILACPENQFRGNDGKCYDCEYLEPVEARGATSYCTQSCPNRVTNGDSDIYCSYDLCGQGIFKDKPLTGSNGKCYSCDYEKSVNIAYVRHEGCEMCDNRIQTSNNLCIIGCPSDKPLLGTNDVCYACDDETIIHIGVPNRDDCTTICPDRYKMGDNDAYCGYELCGQGVFKDKPLTDRDGNCHACNTEKSIDVTLVQHEGCDMCPDTRNQYNNYCVPKCSVDTPLRGSDNKCYPCDTDVRVPVNNMTDACMECPNERKLDGNYCVLK